MNNFNDYVLKLKRMMSRFNVEFAEYQRIDEERSKRLFELEKLKAEITLLSTLKDIFMIETDDKNINDGLGLIEKDVLKLYE